MLSLALVPESCLEGSQGHRHHRHQIPVAMAVGPVASCCPVGGLNCGHREATAEPGQHHFQGFSALLSGCQTVRPQIVRRSQLLSDPSSNFECTSIHGLAARPSESTSAALSRFSCYGGRRAPPPSSVAHAFQERRRETARITATCTAPAKPRYCVRRDLAHIA